MNSDLENIFNIIVSLLQIIFWCFIFSKINEKDSTNKKSFFMIILILGCAIYSFLNHVIKSQLGKDGLTIMVISAIAVYCALIGNELRKRAVRVSVISFSMVTLICICFYSSNIIMAVITSAFVGILFLLVSMLIGMVSHKYHIEYSVYEEAFLTGIFNWIIYMIAELIMNYDKNRSYYIVIFIVLMALATTLVVYVNVDQLYVRKMQNQIMHISYEQNEMNIGNIRKMYHDTARMRHDIRNCMIAIEGFVENREYEALSEYVQDCTKRQKETVDVTTFCSNQVINFIINHKFNICAQKNIQTKCIVSGQLNEISEVDLSILLGNLLDNAIEAAIHADYPSVSVEIYCDDSEIMMIVDNTIKESVLKNNKALKTSKLDKINHGFGVISIRNIANKYDGTVEYSEMKNVFRCKVSMKCMEKKSKGGVSQK